MKLTVREIEKLLKENTTAERMVWDDDVPGLGIRMRPGGSVNWIFQFRVGKKQRRMTLGAVSAIGLVKARAVASDMHAKVRLGEDPAGTTAENKALATETFEPIASRYLAIKEKKIRPRYFTEIQRHLLVDAKPLHGLAVRTIKRRDIADLLSKLRETRDESVANHVRTALSTFFTWAMKEGLRGEEPTNPVTATHKDKTKKGDRVLMLAELREIWDATSGPDDYNDIVRLLMLTLQRRQEIGSLDWTEVDFPTHLITFPGDRVKNTLESKIHMSGPAESILRKRHRIAGRSLVFGVGGGGYSGWSKKKKQLDAKILENRRRIHGKDAQPMKPWCLHDLRRTGDTMMNDVLGIDPHVVEAILNHISSEDSGKAGVAGVYNKAGYLTKKKDALDRWAAHLATVMLFRCDCAGLLYAPAPIFGDRPFGRLTVVPTTAPEADRHPQAA